MVGQVLAAVGVVQRVRGAVGVDLRDEEDVQPVDERGRLGVGPVVAQEPLSGLEADARGRDLVAVLLAVQEHADLGAVARLADPQHVLRLRPARERGGRSQQVAQRRHHAGQERQVAGRDPVQRRRREGGEGRVGVERSDDLRRGAGDRACGVRAQADADGVADDAHCQRLVRRAGVDQLRRQAVAALMPVGVRGQHDRAPLVRGARPGSRHRSVVGVERDVRRRRAVAQHRLGLALIAARLLRQLVDLRDVRELGREVAHLLVRLLRVVVVGHETRKEARRGRVRGDPLADVERVDVAVGGGDLDRRRKYGAVALVADPEDRVVVLVVVRVEAVVVPDPEVAAAQAVAGRVVPLGCHHRARRGDPAQTGRLRVGVGGLDREEAPDVVLVVVRALRPHDARCGARAPPAGGVDAQRALGRLLLGDRRVALGADVVDLVLAGDRRHRLEAARRGERELLVGDPGAHEHPAAGSVPDPVVHAQPERLELLDRGPARELELDLRGIVRTRGRHARRRPAPQLPPRWLQAMTSWSTPLLS